MRSNAHDVPAHFVLFGENKRTKQNKESHCRRVLIVCERAPPYLAVLEVNDHSHAVYLKEVNELSNVQRGGPVQKLSIFNHIRINPSCAFSFAR